MPKQKNNPARKSGRYHGKEMKHRIRMFLVCILWRRFIQPGGLLEPLFNDWKQGRISDKEFGSGVERKIQQEILYRVEVIKRLEQEPTK